VTKRSRQGWTPLIIGHQRQRQARCIRRGESAARPGQDSACLGDSYGVQASPVDDSIWGQAMDVDSRAWINLATSCVFVPGPNPSQTALTGSLPAADEGYGSRASTSISTVWSDLCFRAGHLASFRPSPNATGRSTGPAAATGKQCPEGWTLVSIPGTAVQRWSRSRGAAEHAYYVWVDRPTRRLGPNVPIAMTNGGESVDGACEWQVRQLSAFQSYWGSSARMSMDALQSERRMEGKGLWDNAGNTHRVSTTKADEFAAESYKVQVRPDARG